MRKLLLSSGLALILLAALIYYVSYRSGPSVLVKPDPELKQTVYSVVGHEEKEISLTVYQTELNEKVLRLRSDSTLPLKEQLRLTSVLLDRIKKDRPLTSFTTLFIGRLVMAFGTDETFSKRLSAAARTVSSLSFARINSTVRDIANQQMIYPELKELFENYGIKIKVSAVEKVLVGEDGIPYDCLTWFSMTRQ